MIKDTIERRTGLVYSDYLSDYGLEKKEEIISAFKNLKIYISAKEIRKLSEVGRLIKL